MGSSVQPRHRLTPDEYQKLKAKGKSDEDIASVYDMPEKGYWQGVKERGSEMLGQVGEEVKDIGRSVRNDVQGLTFGLARPVEAAARSLLPGRTYQGELADIKASEQAHREHSPISSTIESLGTNLASGMLLPGGKLAQAGIGATMGATEHPGSIKGTLEGAGIGAVGGLAGGAIGEKVAKAVPPVASFLAKHAARFSPTLQKYFGNEVATKLLKDAAKKMFPGMDEAVATAKMFDQLAPGAHQGADAIGANVGMPIATIGRDIVRQSPEGRLAVEGALARQAERAPQRATAAVERGFNAPAPNVAQRVGTLRQDQTGRVRGLLQRALGVQDANAPAAREALRQELLTQIQPAYDPLLLSKNAPVTDPGHIRALSKAEALLGGRKFLTNVIKYGEAKGIPASEFIREIPPSADEVAQEVLRRQMPSILKANPSVGVPENLPTFSEKALATIRKQVEQGAYADIADELTQRVPTARYAHEIATELNAKQSRRYIPLKGELAGTMGTSATASGQRTAGGIANAIIPERDALNLQYATNRAKDTAIRKGAGAMQRSPEQIGVDLSTTDHPDQYRQGLAYRALEAVRRAGKEKALATARNPRVQGAVGAAATDPKALDILRRLGEQTDALGAGTQALGQTPQEVAAALAQHGRDLPLVKAGAREDALATVGKSAQRGLEGLAGTPNREAAVRALADSPDEVLNALAHERNIGATRNEIAVPNAHPEASDPSIVPDQQYSIRGFIPGNSFAPTRGVAEAIAKISKSSATKINSEGLRRLAPVVASDVSDATNRAAQQRVASVLRLQKQLMARREAMARKLGISVPRLTAMLGGELGGLFTSPDQ